MKRINVYDKDGHWKGWFDLYRATEVAGYSFGSPYKTGYTLYATAHGKLVVNAWNNSGYDNWRFADDEREIAEILARSSEDRPYDAKLSEILLKYEL